MDQYRTEEEQVEALRRWWSENGRSIIAAIIIALSLSFGYQTWQGNVETKQQDASDLYQAMLQLVSSADAGPAQQKQGMALAEQLKADYDGTTYAQFAALHLARIAVAENDLAAAEEQLRWVLGKADKGSDIEQLAQLRLARVTAATGDNDQALAILDAQEQDTYLASYAVARGDILLAKGDTEGARLSYTEALSLAAANPAQVNLATLQQKVQSLNPVPARELPAPTEDAVQAVEVEPEVELESEAVAEQVANPEEQED